MKKIIVICMMLCALVACSTEDFYNANAPKNGIKLTLTTENFDQVTTRAAGSDAESKIESLVLLEFKDGTLIKKVSFPKGTDLSNGVQLVGDKSLENLPKSAASTPDKENQNFVYVLANVSENAVSGMVENTSTVNDLKSLSFAYDKTQAALPMSGGYYGGIENGETSEINVELTRCVAKINFTVNVCSAANFTDEVGSATAGNITEVSINSISLCNVPTTVSPYPVSESTLLPATMDANNSENYEKVSESQNTCVVYMPENHRGIYSNITSNKDKHPSNCGVTDEESDKSFTYLLVDLDYSFATGAKKNATYRIYLGGNETGDMNILRNTQYNVTTHIYGANESDTRINNSVIQILPEDADNANCYMVNTDNADELTLTIPLGQAKLGWDVVKKYDATQTLNIDKILGSGKWKIKTLWKTWQGDNITGTKAADFDPIKPKATLTIPAGVNGNNAVVALMSEDESETYWSWHFWLTDYKPSATGGTADNGSVVQYPGVAFQSGGLYEGKYMMDRNLGATIQGISGDMTQPQTSAEAVQYFGMFYEGDRKDPFVGSADGTSTKVVMYDADNNVKTFPTHAAGDESNLAYSVMNPDTYVTANLKNWTKETNDGAILWAENEDYTGKSPFDPCPKGWKIPVGGTVAKNNPMSGMTYSLFTKKALLKNKPGTAGHLYNGVWYPGSSYIECDGTFTVDNVWYYWQIAREPEAKYNGDIHIYCGHISQGSMGAATLTNQYTTNGEPVRCIQE